MLIDMETLERVAPMIRNVAHPLRLRILDYLEQEGAPRTVTQITEAAGAGQAVVSQQLRILKDQGILAAKRHKTFIYYTLADFSILRILECIRVHQARTSESVPSINTSEDTGVLR